VPQLRHHVGNALGEMTGVGKEKESMKPFFQTFLGSALSAQILCEYAVYEIADACLSVFVVDADVVGKALHIRYMCSSPPH